MPQTGVALYDELPQHFRELFDEKSAASGNNTVQLPFEIWRAGFIHDASADVQRLTYELLVPHPMQYFTESIEAVDWATSTVPVSYVLTKDDISQPLDVTGWPKYIKRLPGVEPILTPGSHEACFTAPETLAAALLRA